MFDLRATVGRCPSIAPSAVTHLVTRLADLGSEESSVMSEATINQPPLQADTVELINTEVRDRLARQSSAGAQIDTKAVVLVGYVIAASSFLATRQSQPVLTGLALTAYAVAAAFGISAYAVGTYQDVPEPRHLLNEYATESKIAALAALAATRVEAFESNTLKHERKAARWQISLAALAAGAVLMFLSLYVHTGSHDGSTRIRQYSSGAGADIRQRSSGAGAGSIRPKLDRLVQSPQASPDVENWRVNGHPATGLDVAVCRSWPCWRNAYAFIR